MDAGEKARGFFVTFEGPEGGGKSTQIHRLASTLATEGFTVWTTREPGGTPLGERIRPLLLGPRSGALSPLSETLLFTAARAQLVAEVIRPRLLRGEVVLCDRFIDSTLAYQGYGRGLDLAFLSRLQEEATGGLRPPLTLLLTLPVQVGLSRIPITSQDRLDREEPAFHARVHDGYLHLAASDPDRWRQVDASASPDVVAATILEHVHRAMERAGVQPAERRSA